MSEWVLLLGGSTGHGGATAKRLAKDGYGIIAFQGFSWADVDLAACITASAREAIREAASIVREIE